jgi:hypothetical protein
MPAPAAPLPSIGGGSSAGTGRIFEPKVGGGSDPSGGLLNGGGLGNINVTVNTGVGDPVEIGKSIVDALTAYKSRTGSLASVLG